MIKIPLLDAPPIPPKKLSGTETTNAHGHETIKKFNALIHHFNQSPVKIEGKMAIPTAKNTTIGV